MSEDIRRRLFEPFFTTKDEGKGTGLGLTTVRSIVTTNGGLIHFDSEPGRGTRAMILLPRAFTQADAKFREPIAKSFESVVHEHFLEMKKESLL